MDKKILDRVGSEWELVISLGKEEIVMLRSPWTIIVPVIQCIDQIKSGTTKEIGEKTGISIETVRVVLRELLKVGFPVDRVTIEMNKSRVWKVDASKIKWLD